MASISSRLLDDESSLDDDFSDESQFSVSWDQDFCEKKTPERQESVPVHKCMNVVQNVLNRQLYGRFTKNPKSKTERVFDGIHHKCKFPLNSLYRDQDFRDHTYMGFTMCGQYFITIKLYDYLGSPFDYIYEYILYIWRFVPGKTLKFVSKHKIFKLSKGANLFESIKCMQFPRDLYKIVLYGYTYTDSDLVYLTILTLPSKSKNCRHCVKISTPGDESVNLGWCIKHGFIVHYMLSMSQPKPEFEPRISLAYPNHLVINTGHHIHIMNISTAEPPTQNHFDSNTNNNTFNLPNLSSKHDIDKQPQQTPTHNTFNDTMSELSETPSEYFGSSSVIDAILEDFNEYDMESSECNKPFHELNISCEPLNVTGKSYHHTIVQNIVDPKLKRGSVKEYLFSMPQSSKGQKAMNEKSNIDKKIAEKAYEFIEENEKCEKISSFRKKRLAEKKYEFSEDNSENIVPFNSLRRELRYRSSQPYGGGGGRCIRSPSDFNSLFLSPRSSRSPMQSPNSWNGQFSPHQSGPTTTTNTSSSNTTNRNLYCPLMMTTNHLKSPISPRESARKFNVYSPSLLLDNNSGNGGDYCSDSDSRLILKTTSSSSNNYNNLSTSLIDNNNSTRSSSLSNNNNNGLLIVDPKLDVDVTPKWIRKVVRRYTNMDFENSSLVSGQSRDDYNIPVEIPLLVQNLTEQQLDVVPEFRIDHVTEMQLIVTQKSFDCEHFIQRNAQKMCTEAQLEFTHCEDYDIRLLHICPLDGLIICQAIIKIGAIEKTKCSTNTNSTSKSNNKVIMYTSSCIFTWCIETSEFNIVEHNKATMALTPTRDLNDIIPCGTPYVNNDVLVMDFNLNKSKVFLRDFNGNYEICFDGTAATASNMTYYRRPIMDYISGNDDSSDDSD